MWPFTRRTLTILFVFLGLSVVSRAETGSHGGKLQGLRPYLGSSLLPGHSVEVVDESEPDSKNRSFRIYLIGSNVETLNLMGVGYWAVEWRTEKKKGRLQDDLKKEKARIWKEKDPYTPLYSFVASGELPDDPDLILEVTIALPGKGGTGTAAFNGVNAR
jgi:hypothetical protein